MEDTKENNKLIAYFMNVKPTGYYTGLNEFKAEYLEYDTSWDWLMPVVEKIEKLGVSTDIHYYAGTTKNASGFYGTELLGYSTDLSIYDSTNQYDTKLESVYKAVVKFIKWYNKNK